MEQKREEGCWGREQPSGGVDRGSSSKWKARRGGGGVDQAKQEIDTACRWRKEEERKGWSSRWKKNGTVIGCRWMGGSEGVVEGLRWKRREH